VFSWGEVIGKRGPEKLVKGKKKKLARSEMEISILFGCKVLTCKKVLGSTQMRKKGPRGTARGSGERRLATCSKGRPVSEQLRRPRLRRRNRGEDTVEGEFQKGEKKRGSENDQKRKGNEKSRLAVKPSL